MKKGSALLIVLGMLAFMVISAVAFSAFMRYARLPSSYLRRTSSSRQLVKAALAEAIDIVDAAIADNPYPGVGYCTIRYPRKPGGFKPAEMWETTRNHWRNHVFIGTNQLIAAEETVSTLTLEGLAYLPPALINEARYYSRHSTAGMWHLFGYDSGRFAFCAVDVSDCLNVNKIPADIGRGSSPENRFSLAYMFENEEHTGYTLQPTAWDTFMEKYVSFDGAKKNIKTPLQRGSSEASASGGGASTIPFVSLADLNLAVNRNGTQFKPYFPFVNYVSGAAQDYVTVLTGPIAEMQRNLNIVADGYFPSSAGTGDNDDLDLADARYQPFTESELDANNVSLRAFVTGGIGTSETGTLLKNRISAYGLVALYDYLDEDQVPVSLALPQTERSPMICGIRQEGLDGRIKINKSADPADSDLLNMTLPPSCVLAPGSATSPRKVQQTIYYKIDGNEFHKVFDGGKVTAVLAYPFRRGDGTDDSGTYALDGHLEFFFTTENQGFRTGAENADIVHMNSDDAFNNTAVGDRAVFHIPLKFSSASSLKPSTFGSDGDDASVKEYTAMLRSGGDALSVIPAFFENNDNALMKVTLVHTQNPQLDSDGNLTGWLPDSNPAATAGSVGVWPIKNGVADESVNNSAVNVYQNGGITYTLRAAVWLRLKNTEEDNKTVDLVPACIHDDSVFVGNNNSSERESISMTGAAYPLMLFTGGSFGIGKADLDAASGSSGTPVSFDIVPKGVMVSDPRWNWAPEHWYQFDTVSQSTWLQEVKSLLGNDGRDPDIFMATSDANYMQSVYELAFLPRLTDLRNVGASSICGNMTRVANASRDTWAASFNEAANNHLMWRTYRPYANIGGSDTYDDFEGLGIVSDGGGTKINPYSGRTDVLMAAFANTPINWWAASANTETGVSESERGKNAASFNKKYAWSGMNSNAKFDWQDLKGVVDNFNTRIKGLVSEIHDQKDISRWEDVYSDLWAADGSNADSLMGAQLQNDTSDLYGIDRKFLYGYWRDCLAVKQQLFLVFVRAEPLMMGGGTIGQTPPQLGARAVALVWRNPYAGSKPYVAEGGEGGSVPANAPHQTRVLFYRQFD